jgi:hypothetical protein
MGHASIGHIGEAFLKLLYAKGSLSIREASEVLSKRGIKYQASEGNYKDPQLIAWAIEDQLFGCWNVDEKILVPSNPTEEQVQLLKDYADDLISDDADDDGFLPIDYVKWKYNKGWRKKYKEIDVIHNITHKSRRRTMIETTDEYWDCECEHNYIHPKAEEVCKVCGSSREDSPDSRLAEVRNMLFR